MMRSLWIAKTGLEGQQTSMDVISNNLANVSTNGFKRGRAVFQDLMYQTLRQPGAQVGDATQLPSGLQLGTGARVAATERIHTAGNLNNTGSEMDIAINGRGFLQIELPDGTQGYTRDGALQRDQNGQLTTVSGYVIQPPINVPDNALSITIGNDGMVSVTQMGTMQTTGRDLDVALSSERGWLAVQTPQGEAYTRAGSLQVGVNGLLQTSLGQPVLSDQGGIIDVPDQAALTITSDGTITAIGAGDAPNNILNLGRLKLVDPPKEQLVHGDDGVFRRAPVNGQPAPPMPADPSLRLLAGVLEGSNTNPMAAMVGMIANARRFEQQMQVIQQSDRNAERANGILSVSA